MGVLGVFVWLAILTALVVFVYAVLSGIILGIKQAIKENDYE